jgi:hypothetical protein
MMNHHPQALHQSSVAILITGQVGQFWKADPGQSPKAPKIRWQVLCSGKVRRCRILLMFSGTVLLRLRRSMQK